VPGGTGVCGRLGNFKVGGNLIKHFAQSTSEGFLRVKSQKPPHLFGSAFADG